MKILTAGELVAALKTFPADTPIFLAGSRDNYSSDLCLGTELLPFKGSKPEPHPIRKTYNRLTASEKLFILMEEQQGIFLNFDMNTAAERQPKIQEWMKAQGNKYTGQLPY